MHLYSIISPSCAAVCYHLAILPGYSRSFHHPKQFSIFSPPWNIYLTLVDHFAFLHCCSKSFLHHHTHHLLHPFPPCSVDSDLMLFSYPIITPYLCHSPNNYVWLYDIKAILYRASIEQLFFFVWKNTFDITQSWRWTMPSRKVDQLTSLRTIMSHVME